MNDAMIPTAAVVMGGLLLIVVAWQVLAIAKAAVNRDRSTETDLHHDVAELRSRLEQLETGVSSSG
jgi:hypothetical protein